MSKQLDQEVSGALDGFEKVARKQLHKGLNKYNQPIDYMDDYNWNDMAMEELFDAFIYITANRDKTRTIIDKVLFDLNEINKLASNNIEIQSRISKISSDLRYLNKGKVSEL